MFFWKKERQVERNIEEYLAETERCLEAFDEAFEAYFSDGLCQKTEQLVEKVHQHEHSADIERREIESDMYGKALIPESRGDILGMLEALDLVPNQCESVLYQIWTQSLLIPDQFVEKVRQLVRVNIDSYGVLCQTMRDLFGKVKRIHQGAVRVTEKEAESDQIERTLIREIFQSDLEKADKILLKELVLQIGSISDRAENAADRLRNIAVKRQS